MGDGATSLGVVFIELAEVFVAQEDRVVQTGAKAVVCHGDVSSRGLFLCFAANGQQWVFLELRQEVLNRAILVRSVKIERKLVVLGLPERAVELLLDCDIFLVHAHPTPEF